MSLGSSTKRSRCAQCDKLTAKGKGARCRRKASCRLGCNKFCWQHRLGVFIKKTSCADFATTPVTATNQNISPQKTNKEHTAKAVSSSSVDRGVPVSLASYAAQRDTRRRECSSIRSLEEKQMNRQLLRRVFVARVLKSDMPLTGFSVSERGESPYREIWLNYADVCRILRYEKLEDNVFEFFMLLYRKIFPAIDFRFVAINPITENAFDYSRFPQIAQGDKPVIIFHLLPGHYVLTVKPDKASAPILINTGGSVYERQWRTQVKYILNLASAPKGIIAHNQKQEGDVACGYYSIFYATIIAVASQTRRMTPDLVKEVAEMPIDQKALSDILMGILFALNEENFEGTTRLSAFIESVLA